MPISDYPAHVLEPRHLTKEEIENPYDLVSEFFSFGHLPEQRAYLTLLFDIAITGNYRILSRREKSDLVYFYHWLEKALEALHLLYTLNDKEEEKA
jgi:hypothetical protein